MTSRAGLPWGRIAPGLFVLLWSTGFIGARMGLPHAEPFTFLTVRFAGVILLLAPLALILRRPWPGDPVLVAHIGVSGLLVHGLYLSGVFISIRMGMPAELSALIVGMQPLLTASVAGPVLGERVGPRQWAGFALGFVGVALVLGARMDSRGLFAGFDMGAVLWALAALLGIAFGTLYQKKFCTDMDLCTGSVVQYVAAGLVTGAAALLLETGEIHWTEEFWFALIWLILVLSVGAVMLLMWLIGSGEAAGVASLFYLVPPLTAVLAWALFGDWLGWTGLGGMAIAALGVALVVVKR